jgi:hypothetical protein
MKSLTSDCIPEPAEGIFWHPAPPDGRILLPAATIVAQGLPSKKNAPIRCKEIRSAMIKKAKDINYKAINPSRAVNSILSNNFWERIKVELTLIHLALPRNDAAVTIDLMARFKDGKLAILAAWPEDPDKLINSDAPWAELGAAVAATADRGVLVDKVGLIWAGDDGCKLEAADPNKALGLWCDAVNLSKFNESRRIAT